MKKLTEEMADETLREIVTQVANSKNKSMGV